MTGSTPKLIDARRVEISMFHALRLMAWDDQARGWRRIQWAVDNRDHLMSLVVE